MRARRRRPIDRRRPTGSDRGSISVEFVAVIPLLIVVTVLLVQGLLAASVVNDVTKAARDGARAASRGGDGAAAVRAQVPDWVRVEEVRIGPGAVTGCMGVCSAVRVSIPLGYPGVMEISRIQVTRTADFPRS
ncbi:MAG: pilus assembly protein [Actinomycetales bacterium]|nr:pilus assembly protein [Actinomycetales bacterium]